MNITQLQKLAKLIRYYILLSTTKAGSGHPSTSLSATDLMTVLFFKYLRFDLDNPDNPGNDRVIFSKGHASPLFYSLYTAAGVISEKELTTMRQFGSVLEGHPTPRFRYTEAATGSLGQGLSVGVGMALALRARISNKYQYPISTNTTNEKRIGHLKFEIGNLKLQNVYVLLGDGEMLEGSVWEAIQIAAHYKLNNLIGILDVNRLAQSEATMYGHDVKAYEKRIKAFGWNTIVIDGHDLEKIDKAFEQSHQPASAKGSGEAKPTMIIAKTIKGKGVSFIEDKNGWHGKALKQEEFDKAVKELGEIDGEMRGTIQKPKEIPQQVRSSHLAKSERDDTSALKSLANVSNFVGSYVRGQQVATRQAYGEALTKLGATYPNVVALDADVKNSTYSEIFKKAYPERFFDMYIAEQNMVGAAVGMAKLGFIPFASTFACFLTRAYDQIRMAALSNANIKLVGSHAGISIGEDGPSQMGLEDFAMFRAVSGSVVLHPADAVATERLVEKMITHKGLIYMRTARPATPVIYDANEEFVIGGSKVFYSSSEAAGKSRSIKDSSRSASWRTSNNKDITIIAAGVTVHEALKAQGQLKSEGIAVRVIDCYSIKPIDEKTLREAARTSKALITVEDHWVEGGLGDAVLDALATETHPPVYKLAVREMPRSGKPAELLDWAGISAAKIAEKIRSIVK